MACLLQAVHSARVFFELWLEHCGFACQEAVPMTLLLLEMVSLALKTIYPANSTQVR